MTVADAGYEPANGIYWNIPDINGHHAWKKVGGPYILVDGYTGGWEIRNTVPNTYENLYDGHPATSAIPISWIPVGDIGPGPTVTGMV